MTNIDYGIYLPMFGEPQLMDVNSDWESLICYTKEEVLQSVTVVHLFQFGYKIHLHCNDYFMKLRLPPNRLATQIMKKEYNICGNCFIESPDKSLSLIDLQKIMEITAIMPNRHWIPPTEKTLSDFKTLRQRELDVYDQLKPYFVDVVPIAPYKCLLPMETIPEWAKPYYK